MLWSSSWVLIRWGLDDASLEPITFAALRYGVAAILLVAWAGFRGQMGRDRAALDRRALVWILILGVVFYAITQGAQFVAIDTQPATTTSVVLAWTPLLVGLLSGWSIAESTSSRQVVGAILVGVGAWWFFAGDLGATVVGMIAAIVGLAANAASALIGRNVNREANVSPVVVTALSMGVGALLLAVVGGVVEGVPVITGRAWLIIGWLAVVNTALAFTLWNRSLRSLSAVESAAINNTMLIQIAILAWVFLGERLGPGEVVGIVLVSVGVFLTQVNAGQRVR